jgi:hypothetical protein
VAKQLTRAQVQSRKDAAVRFLEDVKDDPDRASEVEDESLEDYAARRHFDIIDNPRKRSLEVANANMSKDELLDYIDELESENSDLQDTLDSIQDLVSPPADDDDTGEDGDVVDNVSDYSD